MLTTRPPLASAPLSREGSPSRACGAPELPTGRTQGAQPSPSVSWVDFGGAPSGLAPWGLLGNLRGSDRGNLLAREKGEGICSNQPADLDRPTSYLQRRSGDPDQRLSSSEVSRWWLSLTRERVRVA